MNTSPVKIWRNQKHVREMLGVSGRVISFTQIKVPPVGFAHQAPYVVVVVQSKNNTYTGQLVDCDRDAVIIGMTVSAVLRRMKHGGSEGIIPYGVKFKPSL